LAGLKKKEKEQEGIKKIVYIRSRKEKRSLKILIKKSRGNWPDDALATFYFVEKVLTPSLNYFRER